MQRASFGSWSIKLTQIRFRQILWVSGQELLVQRLLPLCRWFRKAGGSTGGGSRSLDIRCIGACPNIPGAPAFPNVAIQDGQVIHHFQYSALPFGLGPFHFHQDHGRVISYLRTRGTPYLFDLIFMKSPPLVWKTMGVTNSPKL